MRRIAINGFGRIGRLVFRKLFTMEEVEVVAINDLTNTDMLAYLLKYDTAQGRFNQDVQVSDNGLKINGKEVRIYNQKDPSLIPWQDHDVDIVIECTGFFRSKELAQGHIDAGAKKVIISAPAKGDLKTIVYNVNHDILDGSEKIISCASCTTNCLAPMVKVLHDNYGLVTGLMTTVHSYTNDQKTQDSPHRTKLRRARAAAQNIVPSTTGAAKAIDLVMPEIAGRLDGNAQRVPTLTGSLVELVTVLEQKVSEEEVNALMKASANETLGYNTDEIVSSDIIGLSYGSLFDASQTTVITNGDHQLVKTVAWYDNEMSYVSQLVRTLIYFVDLH